MKKEVLMLRGLLKCSLGEPQINKDFSVEFLSYDEWKKLSDIVIKHKIAGIVYEKLSKIDSVPENILGKIKSEAIKTANADFRLLFLSRDILGLLDEYRIPAVLLKGMGTAALYSSPLCRKSGDIDILIPDASRIDDAVSLLEANGFVLAEKQLALHHAVMTYEDIIDVELHSMLAEPFDNDRVNRIIRKQQRSLLEQNGSRVRLSSDDKDIIRREVLGVELRVLGDAFHAYELLLHMLQHYLRSGFGLRLLCDWVVFWNRKIPGEVYKEYLNLVRESHIKGFSDMITLVCYRHLGLDRKAAGRLKPGESKLTRSEIDSYFSDFINSTEFGKVSKDRMVALRGNGIFDYVREFHHQMKLRFPRGSRNVLLWPVLWLLTLAAAVV